MSRIVFSEGHNDLIFLRSLHLKWGSGKFHTFNNETETAQQNRRITQFRHSNYDYLYKAEGGKSKINSMFAMYATLCIDGGIHPCILVDLDSERISDYIDDLNSEFVEITGNSTSVYRISHAWHGEVGLCRAMIEVEGDYQEEFDIVMFSDDLEAATGINSGDSDADKIQKVNAYIDHNEQESKVISNTLYQP